MRSHSGNQIYEFIILNVEDNPNSISHMVTEEFGISRQSAYRYFKKLTKDGILIPKGNTRNRTYEIKPIVEKTFPMPINTSVEDDMVWRENLIPLLKGVKPNVMGICQYGFTEMFNNVIDHSEGSYTSVEFKYTPARIKISVFDNGIGIFNKIVRDLKLEDQLQAILELAKGKLTTDPVKHTGEGIFFTSRVFDKFSILSGKLFFSHITEADDWLIEDRESEMQGTLVTMFIRHNSNKTIQEVFNKHASEDFGFSRTHFPVALAIYGEENLVSRSQAKRILARIDRFKEVFLDFKGVDFVGRAFSDEIFRVYKNSHPNIKITWVNANENVERIIRRTMQGANENQLPNLRT